MQIVFRFLWTPCSKAVESTSSTNFASDTSKFQPLRISLYVYNKDKSLPLLLSTASKAFQCKETGAQVSPDNCRKSKWNSCEEKDYVVFAELSSDMPSNSFIESILNGKRDVSTYKNSFFKALLMQRSMKWYKMFLFLTKVLYFPQLGAYSCTDGLNFFLCYVTH